MVDEMSDNENDITPEIGRKRSRHHKGTSNFGDDFFVRQAHLLGV